MSARNQYCYIIWLAHYAYLWVFTCIYKCLLLTEFGSVSAINVVNVIAVFGQVFRIAGIESQTVTASFQFSNVIITFPVFVAGPSVWVETKIIWAFETVLCIGCNKNTKMSVKKSLLSYIFDIHSNKEVVVRKSDSLKL